jgi:hypothetical protein
MAMSDDQVKPKLEIVEPVNSKSDAADTNPFSNLDALRQAQDYEEFLGGEATTAFAVRTLKEAMHLRVNPDPEYTLLGQYTVTTKQGTYFVFHSFRDALGPLPRRCNLHIAVDGHGEYFLLLVKQPNPQQDENVWYHTARMVATAATQGWVKVTKPVGADRGWGFIRYSTRCLSQLGRKSRSRTCWAWPSRTASSISSATT